MILVLDLEHEAIRTELLFFHVNVLNDVSDSYKNMVLKLKVLKHSFHFPGCHIFKQKHILCEWPLNYDRIFILGQTIPLHCDFFKKDSRL